MIKKFSLMIAAAACVFASCSAPKDPVDKKVADLLKKMTLEEKVGQMTQLTVEPLMVPGTTTPDTAKFRTAIIDYHVGSMFNTPKTEAQENAWWNPYIDFVQELAVNETRLGIPILYGLDQVHGNSYVIDATLFPHQINVSATWNPEIARKQGEITAYEMRASNIPWSFGPCLDLGADPRFARIYEGAGEDPVLAAKMGEAMVKGSEGENNDVDNPLHAAACVKHFLGYGAPQSGKDRTPANIPWSALYEYHVPAFKAAIDAGAHSFMINSGIINNEPVHSSYRIVTELLRNELGFDGMIVSDYEDINKLYTRDHLASTAKEAVKLGVNAGIDMVMVPVAYVEFYNNLIELVKEGEVPMKRIDDAVSRILKLKFQLGLFDKPTTHIEDYPLFGSEEFAKASYDAAAESLTLLMNEDDFLPLDPSKAGRILICGPNADSRRAICGGWTVTWQGHLVEEHPELCKTLVTSVSERFGAQNVKFIPGVSYDKEASQFDVQYKDRFDECLAAARNSDVILLCIGEHSYTEKPGDVNDITLDPLQNELAKALVKTGKPVVGILCEGRPRVISGFSENLKALLQSYLPGPQGADVIADALIGKVNPSGKLPYTYPAFPNSLVSYYHKYADEQANTDEIYKYEGDFNPEFTFGHGLSYTTFEYSEPSISVNSLPYNSSESVTVSVNVKNTGKCAGKEVVQLYTCDLYASLIPDVKRLRAFEKISLEPGESKTVNFNITVDDLAFYNLENKKIAEPGDFIFQVGSSSSDIRAEFEFALTK